MNAKSLLGKKIIDKKARDLAKLAEINVNTKTFTVSNIYGSVGNPLSKKYYNLPVESILAVGDYIQVSEVLEELGDKKLDKIPDADEGIIKINDLIGKTILDSDGNVAGKVSNVEINTETFIIEEILISGSSSAFGKPKDQISLTKEDITSIGDYIIINKVLTPKEDEEEKEEKESVNVNIN
ncbi:MAG: hypothetical protein BZ138_05590 [Methanosphaera sp. rholeuAM270]|nr:MAG: hypothetical protein BZ138_05590 [Methanosphaera sp. rholeuAM270]